MTAKRIRNNGLDEDYFLERNYNSLDNAIKPIGKYSLKGKEVNIAEKKENT